MNEASRILVVDDDPAILQVFSQILRTAGYEVREASTGRQGLQQTREHRPDLVLLDVVLPDMRGVEVCRQIKADAALPDIFVVLFSGEATGPAHKVVGLDTGADDYITKPVNPDEFLARIRTLLRLKRTTTALRVSEQRYRGLAESSPDAIFIVDRNTALQYVNQAAMRWLGRTEGKVLGCSPAEFFPPEIARRQRESLQRAFEKGKLVHAEAWTPFPGGVRWIESHLVPLRDQKGVVVSVMGVARDATKRKRAEESLKEREELRRRIISTAMEGFWMLDLAGNLVEVNEAYCRMSGYSREELLSMHVSDVEVNEPTPRLVVQHTRRITQSGKDQFETRHHCKDGRVMEVEVSATSLKLGKGYVFAFMRDITDRKRIEKELRQLPVRIIESQEAERLRVARELHDGVNQLIASAKMRLRKVGKSVPALKPATREILSRCSGLLVQALEENRRIARNLHPSDLDELGLAAACRNFCRQFQTRTGLAVKCSIARPGRRLAQAVELNLFRILQEVLTNVEKHACAKTVRVQLAFQHSFIVLRIQDDGHGFPARGSKPAKQRGRGVGLTNMRERAVSLGGSCEIKSAPNRGTTVMVRIPRRNATLTRI
jgi:PAS domain S-box-containing protein